jgi:2-dehydro-3-deoxygalactonokinase
MMNANATTWIAVDWGTSNLRVWMMRGDTIVARAQSDAGMGGLSRDGFGPALEALIDTWDVPLDTPIIACGMVGSRQGWVEAPYASVPCAPLGAGLIKVPGTNRNVRIIPGLKQETPADVMRGEETQIAGFLALNAEWDGVICLPGTHSKWAQVSAGEVVSFQTFMTGELFAFLSSKSVLSHSVKSNDWDADAFTQAVSDTLSRPEKLAATLFSIRANDLLHAIPAPQSRARLSGILIGAELAAARPYWLGQNVAIIGADATAGHYVNALAVQGVPAIHADAERMTLAGLTAAYKTSKVST